MTKREVLDLPFDVRVVGQEGVQGFDAGISGNIAKSHVWWRLEDFSGQRKQKKRMSFHV